MPRFSRLLLGLLLTGITSGTWSATLPPHESAGRWPAPSGEPGLHTGPDGTVYLTYAGPGLQPAERALWLATLAPGATAWSAPRPVTSTPLLMENWADFASLTVATDGALWAQWFQQQPGKDSHGYDGWFARSPDGGATWSAPAPLGHEFVSLAPLSGGRVLAVWLESTRDPLALHTKHDPAAVRPTQDPAAPYVPAMRLRARLLAPDGTAQQNWIVDPDVCTCCQTSLAALPGDRALVTYRGHTAGEIRDHRVALFTGTDWTPPRPLHDDGWKISACPVNGPAAGTRGELAAIAWFTAADGLARVQAKQSRDGGLTFGPAQSIDLGRPIGRLGLVMLADGSAVISWLESAQGKNAAGLYVRRLFPDGGLSSPKLIAPTSAARASGFARLAARPGAGQPVVISWTETTAGDASSTQVRTAEFSADTLPRATAASRPAAAPALAVVRANAIEFLEFCAVPTSDTTH